MSVLDVDGASKRFGGVQAVDDVSLHLDQGEILGISGPTGAGKASLFNLITGTIRTDSGRISLDVTDITTFSPHRRARAGIGRTFQVVRPFERMTVAENVMVPVLVHTPNVKSAREKAETLLEELGIGHITNHDVSALTLVQRKRVEVARA